jgi:AbrB family looped-hinge helix DNA binding protein
MGHDFALVRMAENGRISIPAKQRRLLGLEQGALVVVAVEDGELRVRPVKDVVAGLQARVRRQVHTHEGASKRLLAMRREEAEREGL